MLEAVEGSMAKLWLRTQGASVWGAAPEIDY